MIEASAGLYPGEKMKFRDTGHEICFSSIGGFSVTRFDYKGA